MILLLRTHSEPNRHGKSDREISPQDLVHYVTNRSQLPAKTVARIEKERNLTGSNVAIWFELFEKKLKAPPESIDWAKISRL